MYRFYFESETFEISAKGGYNMCIPMRLFLLLNDVTVWNRTYNDEC